MLRIKFRYRDEMSKGKWNEQECIFSSLKQCKEFYGLGVDCEYQIISIKEE